MTEGKYRCAFCGMVYRYGTIMGSLKHPICIKCMKEKFNNNIKDYFGWMVVNHP